MRYFDRRILFPIAAVSAFAQQQSPEAAATEAAVRARAQDFFQLQVDKKYRQAESMVADESKDAYYDGRKFNIKAFEIEKIALSDNNTRAKVTIKAKVTLILAGAGSVDLEVPSTTNWKLQHDQWFYEIEPELDTPFGKIRPGAAPGAGPTLDKTGQAPDISKLMNSVKIDQEVVTLTSGGSHTATITNNLPGEAILELPQKRVGGVEVELDKTRLAAGEQATVRFSTNATVPESRTVQINVLPLGTTINVRVDVK